MCVARVSLQVLEQTARELVEEDWDLDEALWVLAQVCKVEPQLQLKVGLYRHGGVVGVLGGTSQRPWLTELMVQVLSAVAPGAEYTSLWLSNSTVQPVHVDSQNLQGSTNVVLPVKLPRVGGELWVELQPGDVPSSVVEERVDGKGHRFLGVTHQLQKGKPFFLDPRRRHATAPWEGERVVLVAYTVNTLGKVPESDLQALESLGFPLPGSTRLPLTQQQDVRRLDAFECFKEEPLREAQEGVERVVGGDLLRGGGWKETQKVEAGTVELEVSWNLKHKPVPQAVSPEQALHTLQGAEQVEQPQVEEETVSGEGSWPEPPLQWELWVPLPQEEGQVCTRRSGDLAGDNLPQLRKSEPVYTPDIELLLDALQEPLNVVHTVDPRDAERNYEKWMPAIHKEVGVIEKAVQRLAPEKVKEGGWLRRKEVKVVPSKLVFTVKPPRCPARPG